MSALPIPPLPLFSLERAAQRQVFALPSRLRRNAADAAQPCVVVLEAPGEGLALSVEGAQGDVLAECAPRSGRLIALLLPQGAARLALTGPEADKAGLGYYPLEHWRLTLAVLRDRGLGYGLKRASQTAREMRRALKRALWTSPAASLMGLPAYRRFRERHIGSFDRVVPVTAAPLLTFVTEASSVSLSPLADCAAALNGQSDGHFRWRVVVPASRLVREEAALRAALGERAELISCTAQAPAAGLAQALGDVPAGLVTILNADGVPTRDAVAIIRAAFAEHPDCLFLYTDEEYVDSAGKAVDGAFKPAFNRHLLEAMNYIGSFAVMRAERVSELGLRPTFEGAALYDLMLRYLDGVDPARIRHVPRIAYSGPATGPGFPDEATARQAAAALAEIVKVPVDATPGGRHLRPNYRIAAEPPLVSIIIPTRDRAGLLGTTLRSLIGVTAYRNIEIVIVDNGSSEAETFSLFEEIERLWPATQIVRDDGDFNFSRLCNAGIGRAHGELLLLLNNDMEIVDPAWLDEMVALASLPASGIVGAKLLYPDRTVQHAGFIVGLRSGAGSHWLHHAEADAPGYQERLVVRQNLSAVTGACLMIRRDCLEAAGLLDEERFGEECNDVDLCLRARRAGFEVVFTPFAQLLHHESASRGDDVSVERPRRKAERLRFEARWSMQRHIDPHFSPNLDRHSEYVLRATAPAGDLAPRTDAIWAPVDEK